MTHVSRKVLSINTENALRDALYSSLSQLSKDKLGRTFSVLITKTEELMIIKRLAILLLLKEGLTVDTIAKATGTTHQTVSRIKLQLLEVPDKDKKLFYKNLSKWKNVHILKSTIKDLINIKSRSQIRKKVSPF